MANVARDEVPGPRAGNLRQPADQHAGRAVNVYTFILVASGNRARHIGADEVALQEMAQAFELHTTVIRRDDVAGRGRRASNRVARPFDEYAPVTVTQGQRARHVGADEVPLDDVSREVQKDAHPDI